MDFSIPDFHTLSRSGDPETSHDAAESLSEGRKTMALKLLKAFEQHPEGLTAEEASDICGYSADKGAWKRVSDLKNAGYLRPKTVDGVEVTRLSSSNRSQRVLTTTYSGSVEDVSFTKTDESPRDKSKYEPHFDIDFQRGKVGEDSHELFLDGKHEVKTDYRTAETGNFYVETKQYNEGMIALSGINVTESDYWVWASPTGDGAIYIKTEALKELMRETDPPESRQPIINEHTNASVGRLVPLNHVLRKLGFVQ